MSETKSSSDVLAFWRAAGEDKWFEKDDAFDRAIRDNFSLPMKPPQPET